MTDLLLDDTYDDVLDGASRLRRESLVAMQRQGDARKLIYRGADHAAVRRWIDQEQSTTGLLHYTVRREPSGSLCVSAVPVGTGLAARALLHELAGE